MAKLLPIDDAMIYSGTTAFEDVSADCVFLTIFGVMGLKKYKEDIQVEATGLEAEIKPVFLEVMMTLLSIL